MLSTNISLKTNNMFSGIVEAKAKIISKKEGRFCVENVFDEPLNVGQSIAHDGACMSVETCDEKSYIFFAMEETFKKTNFSQKKPGDFFNVERCIKVGDRIDGHFVTGHIDGTGKVKAIKIEKDGSKIIEVYFPKEMRKYLIPKGSIAINGVSLTVVDLAENLLSVSLIPQTLQITNLGDLQEKDIVNLEFDMVGKYILNKDIL